MGQAHDVAVRAERATDELAMQLLLEVIAGAEPALEAMVVLAAQIKNDHYSLRTGPLSGRMVKPRPPPGHESPLIQQ
jgi:hypothetical protein